MDSFLPRLHRVYVLFSYPKQEVQLGSPQRGQKKAAVERVIFVYNGHSFDACETLGLKPGCSISDAEAAVNALKKTVEPASLEFVEAAFEALRDHLLNR